MLFLRSLFEAIYSARNTLDYSLRRRIHWRRGGVPFRNEPKKDLFNDLPPGTYELAHEAEVRLRQEYHLQAFYTDSTCENYRENLFYLEMLERALGTAAPQFTSTISACDIGPSSWFYVQALAALLQWWGDSEIGREAALYGYEVDAYRVYADFRSRCDHALAHMRDLSDVHYIPASFRRQDGKFDVITHLFPFILLPDHLIWGLPRPAVPTAAFAARRLGEPETRRSVDHCQPGRERKRNAASVIEEVGYSTAGAVPPRIAIFRLRSIALCHRLPAPGLRSKGSSPAP